MHRKFGKMIGVFDSFLSFALLHSKVTVIVRMNTRINVYRKCRKSFTRQGNETSENETKTDMRSIIRCNPRF